MKTFKQFLKEETDPTSTVDVRAVTPKELEIIKDAKSLAAIVHAAIQIKKLSVEDISKLRDEFSRFSEFKFLNKSIKTFDVLLSDHGKMMSGPAHIKQNIDQIKHHSND